MKEARVNLATERASVVVDPSQVEEAALADAVARAGYAARRAELLPGEGAGCAPPRATVHVAYWRRRLIAGLALDAAAGGAGLCTG